MEKITENLIKEIDKTETKEELFEIVTKEHNRVKDYLLKKGRKFFDDESQYSQELIGEQYFFEEEEAIMAKTYEELNYFRIYLKIKKIQDSDEQERYNPIKKKAEEIIKKFNLKYEQQNLIYLLDERYKISSR